jgi:hypothetical protein
MATMSAPRQARVLTAWISAEDSRRIGGSPDDQVRRQAAREALCRRAAVDQSGLLADWPAALAEHEAALRASEGAKWLFAGGWELKLITDLRRVIAAQPLVFVDQMDKPFDVVPSDLASIARIALPLSAPDSEVPVRFDEATQTWTVSSPSPNLRITGNWGGQVEPGVLGFGFLMRVLPSFLSVVEYRGRYILRDGYHRAYRFLSAGISTVPVFVRRFADDQAVFSAGMLPQAVFCGERPPTLQDYHDDAVAETVWHAPTDTSIVVSAAPTSLVFGRVA